MPQLIEQLESGKAPAADVLALAARAHLLAAGKSPGRERARPPPPTSLTTQFATPSLAAQVPEPEPSLSDIYARETDSHVSTVRAWLGEAA